MGVVIKQSFWTTVISYLGVVVGYLNTLYLRAEYFDLSQIGLFTLITANAMMVSSVSSLGAGSSWVKYFPLIKQDEKNRFFSFLFLLTITANLLVFVVAFLFKDALIARYVEAAPKYIDYLWITAIIIVANTLFELFFALSRSIMKVIFPTFLRDIYLRAAALLLVFGYAVGWWDFDGAAMGLGITYLSAFGLLLVQILALKEFRFDFRLGVVSKYWRIQFLKFGSYAMLMAGTFAIINNISYEQITSGLGADFTGIFQTCFFIAVIVEMPFRNMAKVLGPVISKEFQLKNMPEVESLYKRSSISLSVFGLLLTIGIITNLDDLFLFIPKGESFALGKWVVVAVCMAKMVNMVAGFAPALINFSEVYRYNLFFQAAAAVLLVGLNYVLIPIMGLDGAAIAYLAAISFQNAIQVLFVNHKFGLHPFSRSHLKLILLGAAVLLGAHFFSPEMSPVASIVLRSVLTASTFAALAYFLNISRDINSLIDSTFERFLKIKLKK